MLRRKKQAGTGFLTDMDAKICTDAAAWLFANEI